MRVFQRGATDEFSAHLQQGHFEQEIARLRLMPEFIFDFGLEIDLPRQEDRPWRCVFHVLEVNPSNFVVIAVKSPDKNPWANNKVSLNVGLKLHEPVRIPENREQLTVKNPSILIKTPPIEQVIRQQICQWMLLGLGHQVVLVLVVSRNRRNWCRQSVLAYYLGPGTPAE